MARITVIIAARNAARTLPETLASLAAQTSDEWRAIVVDDASTDGTGELAAALGDRVTVVRNDTNLGPAGSRNRGVAAATTPLVATLDADDRWEPTYLERQLAAYDRARVAGRRVAVVCTDAGLIDGEGQPCGRWSDRVALTDSISLDVLLRENVVYNSVLVDRQVFETNGGYNPELTWGEDYDLWLRLVEQEWDIVVNPEPVAIYRLHPAALSADSARINAGTRRVYELALGRGRLSHRQRGIARRQRRLHALLERRALRAGAKGGLGAAVAAVRLAPTTVRVALEHPDRWTRWLRHGPRQAAAGRHA